MLACVFGLCVIVRYICCTFLLVLEGRSHENSVDIITLPLDWVAQAAVVLMGARLLVMYYPLQREKYGRYINEKRLVCVLISFYVLFEVSSWTVATRKGRSIVASNLVASATVPPLLTITAATLVGWQLRDVDDSSNLARDVRLVVVVMIISFPVFVVAAFLLQPDSLAKKYATIVCFLLSHTPVVWILNIRPVREILVQDLGHSFLFPCDRMSVNVARVAITTGVDTRRRPRVSYVDSTRLEVIMGMETLHAAFGAFCHKSLCGESFMFLEDVSTFKSETLPRAESNANLFKGFGGYLAIVNDFIRDTSHLEVNINSTTKRDILSYAKFEVYSSLDLDERKDIFSAAEKEVLNVLADNLLTRFILSRQYKAIVDSA